KRVRLRGRAFLLAAACARKSARRILPNAWRLFLKHSDKRILTTHVGSLIRPPELIQFLRAKRNRDAYDEDAYQRCLTDSVAETVQHQAKIGLDVISDGEFGKSISWSQYVLERLAGLESRPSTSGHDPY